MKDKKIVKSVISWILYIVVLIGLIYGIPRGLSYALDTPYPMAAITSGSMWPALKQGDMVLIKGIDDRSEIDVADIIVYQNPNGFTIHRVIEINQDSFITKGDANNTSDPAVHYDEIIGKTLTINDKPFRIPKLGLVSILISKSKL